MAQGVNGTAGCAITSDSHHGGYQTEVMEPCGAVPRKCLFELEEWKKEPQLIALGWDRPILEDGPEFSGSSEGSSDEGPTGLYAPGCESIEEQTGILQTRGMAGGQDTVLGTLVVSTWLNESLGADRHNEMKYIYLVTRRTVCLGKAQGLD
jgi:hypothetical protein